MKKVCIVVVISVAIAACSAKTFAPTDRQLPAMQQKVPGITLESARAGYTIYSKKCAGCHQLYHPGKYTIVQWNRILPKMFPRAKVTNEDQEKLITDYLQGLSK
jgi:cytochrome c5